MRNFHIVFAVLAVINLLLAWLVEPILALGLVFLFKFWLLGIMGYWIGSFVFNVIRACKQ